MPERNTNLTIRFLIQGSTAAGAIYEIRGASTRIRALA